MVKTNVSSSEIIRKLTHHVIKDCECTCECILQLNQDITREQLRLITVFETILPTVEKTVKKTDLSEREQSTLAKAKSTVSMYREELLFCRFRKEGYSEHLQSASESLVKLVKNLEYTPHLLITLLNHIEQFFSPGYKSESCM